MQPFQMQSMGALDLAEGRLFPRRPYEYVS